MGRKIGLDWMASTPPGEHGPCRGFEFGLCTAVRKRVQVKIRCLGQPEAQTFEPCMVFVGEEDVVVAVGYEPQSNDKIAFVIKDIESLHVTNEPFSAERKLKNIERRAAHAILCSL